MSAESDAGRYLTAMTEAGLIIIHSLPITLSWVPRDVVNDVYNVGGIVTLGTFASLDEAKHSAKEQYSIGAEDWQVSEVLPFDVGGKAEIEVHTPEIDGHKFVRHGTHWK